MSAEFIFLIAITLFSWICAGCTVHFFWQCLCDPTNLEPTNIHSDTGEVNSIAFCRSAAYFIFVWIGIGYCIYKGAEATLQWMPRSWVRFSDEGEPEWVGYGLAVIAAFYGSYLLIVGMCRLAERLKDAERDRWQ